MLWGLYKHLSELYIQKQRRSWCCLCSSVIFRLVFRQAKREMLVVSSAVCQFELSNDWSLWLSLFFIKWKEFYVLFYSNKNKRKWNFLLFEDGLSQCLKNSKPPALQIWMNTSAAFWKDFWPTTKKKSSIVKITQKGL